MNRGLRLVLLLDAAGMLVASSITDPIIGDVALAPLLLVSVLGGIACLSGDLVRPRRRVAVVCSSLTIVAPFPFLALGAPWGPRAAGVAVAALQVIPLVRMRGQGRAQSSAPRTVVSALVATTAVLLVLVVALVWYGATYLLAAPTGAFDRAP